MFDAKRIGKFDAAAVGKRIKILRESNHITRTKLAEMIGVFPQTLIRYENGERDILSKYVCDIAVIFDVSTDYILGSISTDARQAEYIQSEKIRVKRVRN